MDISPDDVKKLLGEQAITIFILNKKIKELEQNLKVAVDEINRRAING